MFLLVVRDEENKDTELEPRFSQARASFKPIGVCHLDIPIQSKAPQRLQGQTMGQRLAVA